MSASRQDQSVADMLAARRKRGSTTRDLTDIRTLPTDAPTKVASPGKWLTRIVVHVGILAAIGAAIVLAPPLLSCREQAAIGFFAGDSYGRCTSRALAARMTALDQRLRMILLGSGR